MQPQLGIPQLQVFVDVVDEHQQTMLCRGAFTGASLFAVRFPARGETPLRVSFYHLGTPRLLSRPSRAAAGDYDGRSRSLRCAGWANRLPVPAINALTFAGDIRPTPEILT